MRAVTTTLAAAIEAPERTLRISASIDWDGDGHGTTSLLSFTDGDGMTAALLITPTGLQAFACAGDGTTDDTASLQAALNAAYVDSASSPIGYTVRLTPGTYRTSAPLIVPPYVTLEGAYVMRGTNTQKSVIKPLSTFVGTSVLSMVDATAGGYSTTSEGQRIKNLTIDGSALGAVTASGILATGLVHGVIIQDVGIDRVTDRGVSTASNGTGHPYSWHLRNVQVSTATLDGFRLSGTTDATVVECRAIGCGRHGWYIDGLANSTFVACRSEFSGQRGWYITAGWGTGTGSGGATFTACTTDRSEQSGFYIDATGSPTLSFVGCVARRDGRNGGSGSGGYAAFQVASATTPIIVAGLSVYPGVDDNGTGSNSPQYGVSVAGSTQVVVDNSSIHAASQAWLDGGSNTVLVRGPGVIGATGTTASPTRETLQVDDYGVSRLGPDHGLLGSTADPALVSSGKLAVNGTVYLARLYVRKAATATKLYWGVNTAGVTATAGQNFVGLYDSTGTRLASVGVDARVTTTGVFTETISAAVTPGYYYVAFVFNASTAPQPYRTPGDLSASLANLNIGSASRYRFATNGTGQTSLPSSLTLGSNSASQAAYWAALA